MLLLTRLLPLLRRYWVHIILVAATATGAWYLWSPKPAPPETYKPAVVQGDGSTILERKPDADAKPKAAIPKGSKVERIVRLTIKAKNPINEVSGSVEIIERVQMDKSAAPMTVAGIPIPEQKESLECPPVDLELTLVKMPDDTRRVIVSSDNGEITGIDIPVESAKPTPETKKWAVGAVIDPFKQTYGAFIDRDIAFMRVGAEVVQRNQGDMPNMFIVKAGIRF